jgi:hypothetical protein
MGLAEYIKAGAVFKREEITLATNNTRSGSVDLGSAYMLLSITTNAPCRFRLYDNQSSRDVVGEVSRSFGNTFVSNSIALVGDFSMSAADTYTIDPAMFGVVDSPTSKLSYYRIDNASPGVFPTIIFNKYLLEDSTISTTNRMQMPTITATLNSPQTITGSITATSIPRTYLLVSASMVGTNNVSRIRLYSTSHSLSNPTEISRSFATESADNTNLIVDAILSGSQTTYFVPKIIGANLRYMTTDLNDIRFNKSLIMGENELYYILQNLDTSGGSKTTNVYLHVFSMED